jgi:F-type H+-transporting ATPase subunit b
MKKRFLVMLAMAAFLLAPVSLCLADTPDAPGFKNDLIPNPPISGQSVTAAIWTIAIFLILLIILYPTAWKQVLAGLKAREERIRKDIADAEAARIKAEQTLSQYTAQLATAQQQARETIAQAAAEAEKIATSMKLKAQQEAEEAKEKAIKEIEIAKQAANGEIYDQTATLATSIAEKIIRRTLNANDQRDLVNQSLQQLKNLGNN